MILENFKTKKIFLINPSGMGDSPENTAVENVFRVMVSTIIEILLVKVKEVISVDFTVKRVSIVFQI